MSDPTPELLAACDEIAEHVASMLAQGKLLNIRDFTNTQKIVYGIMKQEFSRGVAAFVQAREQAARLDEQTSIERFSSAPSKLTISGRAYHVDVNWHLERMADLAEPKEPRG